MNSLSCWIVRQGYLTDAKIVGNSSLPAIVHGKTGKPSPVTTTPVNIVTGDMANTGL
jgi:hypothetical protein